jgi:hypothetical protein
MHVEAKTERQVKDAGRMLRDTLDMHSRVERNPYGMLAGALGIGFVLGGGLFSRFTARILGAGLRLGLMAAIPIIEKTIVQAITGAKSDTPKGE